MPRPSSPSSRPQASSNSTSLLALLRLPSLSLSRCSRTALRLPSGHQRGTKKQAGGPASPRRATTRCASAIGADRNHLWPRSRYSPPLPAFAPSGVAQVVLLRTSEPPCFSVMPMPIHSDGFCAIGTSRGSQASL